MWRPAQKQKIAALMKHDLRNFSKLDDLVLDGFVPTCSTAKVCLLLNKHKTFLEYHKYSVCVEISVAGLWKCMLFSC